MAQHLIERLVSAARADPAVDLSCPAAVAILEAEVATRAAAAALIASELRGGLVEGFLSAWAA